MELPRELVKCGDVTIEALLIGVGGPLAVLLPGASRGADDLLPLAHALEQQLGQAVGALFRKAGRVSDAIGRLGPTEFAVIAPATDDSGVQHLVHRLREAIESEPVGTNGHTDHVKLKAGYCVVPDFRKASLEATELLLRATTALRQLSLDSARDSMIRNFDEE